jgi:hypothetical protein
MGLPEMYTERPFLYFSFAFLEIDQATMNKARATIFIRKKNNRTVPFILLRIENSEACDTIRRIAASQNITSEFFIYISQDKMSIQQRLNEIFPPNRANPTIVGPLQSVEQVHAGLSALAAPLPPKLDLRVHGLLPPTNQMHCGDCWAQSSTNALTDKFRMAPPVGKSLKGLELNQLLTTICTFHNFDGQSGTNQECGGGLPYIAGKYFERMGAAPVSTAEGNPIEGCPESWETFCKNPASRCAKGPVNLPNCNSYSNCLLTYQALPGSTTTLSAQKNGKVAPYATINNIKMALMDTGPVVATFFVPADFMFGSVPAGKLPGWGGYMWNATDGVYVNGSYNTDLDKLANATPELAAHFAPNMGNWGAIIVENGNPAAHAVEVVGWDETGKYPHWIVKNSWGTTWGDGGYWKHAIYPNNEICALDVPKQFSQVSGQGGCTNFKADIHTGGKIGTRVGTAGSSSGSGSKTLGVSKKTWMIILYVALGILGVYLLIWLGGKMFSGRKRGGSYK